jgi:hypothetical protein
MSIPQQVTTNDLDLSLHNQDLVDVMDELQRCQGDPRADFAYKQAETVHVLPLSEEEFKPLRAVKGGPFDPSQYDLPLLQPQTLFEKLVFPCTEDVQAILKKDMEGDIDYSFAPTRGSSEKDTNAAMRLLNHIGVPNYEEPGAIMHMRSFTIERAKADPTAWEAHGLLGHSVFGITVAPAKEIFDIEVYQNFFSTTLLSGSKVWLVFPPTQANLDRLHQVYKAMRDSQEVPHILPKMQHGLVIIQKPGQTLLLPPYWPAMAFSTQTSVSCGFFTATASTFMQRVKCIDLRLAITALCDTSQQQQLHLVNHATELATHLSNILGQTPKGVKVAGIQQDVYREWIKTKPDAHYQNLHQKVARLLSMINDKETVDRIRQSILRTWIDFAEKKRVQQKKRACFWCRMKIEDMPGAKEPKKFDQRLARHVEEVHCSL